LLVVSTARAAAGTWGSGWFGRRREAKWGRVPAEASLAWPSSDGSLGLLVGARPEGLCAILPKWFLPTRLETRTKESNIYASVLVEKPTRVMKVSGAKRKRQHRPTMILW
jgi:hypothetical protein